MSPLEAAPPGDGSRTLAEAEWGVDIAAGRSSAAATEVVVAGLILLLPLLVLPRLLFKLVGDVAASV